MYTITNQDDLCSKNLTFFSCGLMRLPDCGGANQTFATVPFSMPPEDLDKEPETDDTVRNILTLYSTIENLQRTVDKQYQTLRDKDKTLQEKDREIEELRARSGIFK